jgi:ABC-2 type transport system permease protein
VPIFSKKVNPSNIFNFWVFNVIFPIDSFPSWLKSITLIDPLTYGVEGIRYGLLGTSSISPLTSGLVLGSITLLMVILGAYIFRKVKV